MVRGKIKVVDAHCHIYPEKISSKATAGTDRFYNIGHSAGTGRCADLIERGKKAGTDRFIVQSVATTVSQVKSINRFIAGEVEASKGLFVGFGTLHPDSETIEEDFEELLSLGLCGVKLHPDIQRFAINEKKCNIIYELCLRASLPILMHTGDKRYNYSNPDCLIPVLRAYPSLTVIGAHLGGWSVWREAREKLCRYGNLYVDCSSSMPFLTDDEVKRSIESFGVSRVIYGTDYPMWSPEEEIGHFLSLGYSDSEYEEMLSGNIRKIVPIDL